MFLEEVFSLFCEEYRNSDFDIHHPTLFFSLKKCPAIEQ